MNGDGMTEALDRWLRVMSRSVFAAYCGAEAVILRENRDGTVVLGTDVKDYVLRGSETEHQTVVDAGALGEPYGYRISADYQGVHVPSVSWSDVSENAVLQITDSDESYGDPRLKSLGFDFFPADYLYSKVVGKDRLENLQLNRELRGSSSSVRQLIRSRPPLADGEEGPPHIPDGNG